jgi:hypothetical protein
MLQILLLEICLWECFKKDSHLETYLFFLQTKPRLRSNRHKQCFRRALRRENKCDAHAVISFQSEYVIKINNIKSKHHNIKSSKSLKVVGEILKTNRA